MQALASTLRAGLTALDLTLSDAQVDSLLAYHALIQKWNKVYNLTAVRDPGDMLTHHLLDSLAVIVPLRRQLALMSPSVKGGAVRLLDVGSGAGLPGVVAAICCPDIRVDCVDTVGKKAAFIQQVAVTLRLTNLRGVHARVESLTDQYQIISSRAFASLTDFTHWSAQALAPQGVWLAMKGRHPADELAALSPEVQMFHVEHLTVPGLEAERCLIWMKPVDHQDVSSGC
ncbi:16S rRNA (guanine(527)-N(7))-methyltransferase RsmG [Rhodoferax sp.]|uniref:16S rRNA (guanine(527)-N(7))-methyltransferase RsmG n=1 Tax=Rhodoferax sp. TaxID=50421 RepID=UPI00271F55D7|nr:16S rRNA (guanine(527)-N(7))-methyltransferase RsmG [Rhodoferax sp.]MDO8317771.1 16S rRNA (guanine(527)-N(7))-methyltransferase RsmG [Rhodoferax sp.]